VKHLLESHWLLIVMFLALGVTPVRAAEYDPDTTVYIDALWFRAHAADCPSLILKEHKQTMTLEAADQAGARIGESGQSGRENCCLVGYQRSYPPAVIEEDAMGVVQKMKSERNKYHVHGCHRFTPDQQDRRMTLADARGEYGFYLCEHCEERGPGYVSMTDEGWNQLPSGLPWEAPEGWSPSPFATDTLPPQAEVDILRSQTLHGNLGIQERVFTNPVATVENFMTMRFFFPVHRWLELYQAYRSTGDAEVLEQLRGSARHYNTLSKNYRSAARKKAADPEGMAYLYTMAASARITLQLALKYPERVTAAEIAEAEDFLVTIISVLQPACEGDDNLDPQMGIPRPLANDFRTRAFNRALNGIGTIGLTTAALQDLQVLRETTAYQPTIDRYRKVIEEYINNWKNTGFSETYEGQDYFSYPYSASDSGYLIGDVKLFGADDQGHFSHSMQGCYLLYESVPELGVDDAFMTAIANTIHFNALTETSGSPQTPSQEAIRPKSRKPYGAARERLYLLEAFKDGVIDAQCVTLSAWSKEAANSEYDKRIATLNAHYLKALREDPSLIYLGDESALIIRVSGDVDFIVSQPIPLLPEVSDPQLLDTLDSILWEKVSGPGEASFSDSSALEPSVTFSESGTYLLQLTLSQGATTHSATTTITIRDTSPPASPTGLSAVAGEGAITVNWDDNTETDFAAYHFYRSETPGSYGEARAPDLVSSEFVDYGVVAGRTYYYRVVALDMTGNASQPGTEVSAVAAASAARLFGSDFDGFNGFTASPPTGTEAWSLTADSVHYAFGMLGADEAHTASLLKAYPLDRSEGSYRMEGVVSFTDGYGDDNNRIGLLLFNETDSQTADGGGGLYLRLHTDSGTLSIRDGINGADLASVTPSGAYSGDSWVGTTLTYTALIAFTGDLVDVTFIFTDQDGVVDSLNAQVPSADYPGEYFGFATKIRNRGSVSSNRDVPPILNYRSFSMNQTNPVGALVDTNANGIDDAWERENFGGLVDGENTLPGGVPHYFLYLSGWTQPDPIGNAGRIQITQGSSGSAPTIVWEFREDFELGVHAEVWMSTDLLGWSRMPTEHFTHTTTPSTGGKTRHELAVTHDYGGQVFLHLKKPAQP
jgi:hypothetical protein